MRDPHPSLTGIVVVLALCASAFAAAARAQRPRAADASAPDASVEVGLRFYGLGGWKRAVKEFRNALKGREDDAALWLHLGRALFRNGDIKEARKAFEASLKLRPEYADARAALASLHLTFGTLREADSEARKALASEPDSGEARLVVGEVLPLGGDAPRALAYSEEFVARRPDSPHAHLLKARSLLELSGRRGARDPDSKTVDEAKYPPHLRLHQAAQSLERYVRLSPNAHDAAPTREQLESLSYYAHPGRSGHTTSFYYTASMVTTPAKITSQPRPPYTEEARRARVSGVVRLRAVLHAGGTVKHVPVLKGLSHGLTENAVAAAHQIRFKPAAIRGETVSQSVLLEYDFNDYY